MANKKIVDDDTQRIIDKAMEEPEEPLEPEGIDEPENTETEESSLPENSSGNGNNEMSVTQMELFEKREMAKRIPGYGHLFHVDDDWLPESVRLTKAMEFAFAARDMQQATILLDPKNPRKQSAWDIFKNKFMRYTISDEGKGRDDAIALHHLTTEEKEAAAQGGLVD